MPPTSRPAHDPFTDAPLRPTSSNAVAATTSNHAPRHPLSHPNARTQASAAASRSRTQRELFAPPLSRRPLSRTTAQVEDEVLADSESELDIATAPRQRHVRRGRRGSPEAKHTRPKQRQAEELDIVNRQADGNYLIGATVSSEVTTVPSLNRELEEEAERARMDELYVTLARQHFTSGTMTLDQAGKDTQEDLEQMQFSMMLRLREQVTQKIENESWLYEPVDRLSMGFP